MSELDKNAVIGTRREFRTIGEVRAAFYPRSAPLLDLPKGAIIAWRPMCICDAYGGCPQGCPQCPVCWGDDDAAG